MRERETRNRHCRHGTGNRVCRYYYSRHYTIEQWRERVIVSDSERDEEESVRAKERKSACLGEREREGGGQTERETDRERERERENGGGCKEPPEFPLLFISLLFIFILQDFATVLTRNLIILSLSLIVVCF